MTRARPRSILVLALALAPAGASASPPPARGDATDACIQASDEGQVLRDQGKLIAARARFLACSRESCPRLVRTDCTSWLSDADARIPSVVLSAQDPSGRDVADVKVTLDGAKLTDHLEARAIPLDPGEHRFRFERPGLPAVEETLILREGELRRAVAVHFGAGSGPTPPPPSPGPTRGTIAAAATLGALGIAGGAVFAYLAATAKSDADHLRATCAPNCDPAAVDPVRTRLIGANVALGLGIASAAAALGVGIWGPRETSAAPAVSVVPGGAFFSLRAKF